ncbi:MAG: LUD domain-containing protein [Bacteroidia bacterium]
MRIQDEFLTAAGKIAFDRDYRKKINDNISHYEQALENGLSQYANLELARDRASFIKWKVIENLDKYLIEFEASVVRRGGKVLWAIDVQSAQNEIDQILKKTNAKTIVKSKTMVGEEIGLTDFLRKKNIEVYETDLGDFIIDKAGETPFHFVTPAMQKSRSEIAQLLNEKIGSSLEADETELSNDVRNELREKFLQADIGITGANFLIAENGMVSITENEGNARLSFTFAKTHIVVAGIEKVIPSLNDLDVLLPLLSTYSTGQKITAYNSVVGPKISADEESSGDFFVILVDNGRSNLLAQGEQRQALQCIKCGACLNSCPVFKTIGGHTYGSVYMGPIGSVTSLHTTESDSYSHLSFASTLCGKCTDVCPVKIDLHNHLLRNRKDIVNEKTSGTDKILWFTWKKMMLNRKNLNQGAGVKNFMFKKFFKNAWGERRDFPKLADKSFNQLWKEKNSK